MDHRETTRKYWYKQKSGKPGKQLPPNYKRMSNKQIVCIEYMEITEDDEREIFRVRCVNTHYVFQLPNSVQIREYNSVWPSITPRR